MKIAIVYICTGKYDRFFGDFYESSENLFIPGSGKTYFVWTDSELESFNKPNVIKTHQEKLGWPFDTLMRFNMFVTRREELLEFDYVFFFNANMKILKEMSSLDVLPTIEDNWLVSVEHPGYPDSRGPLESRIESTAYINPLTNTQYRQGCLFGGASKEFINMIDELDRNVSIDLEKDIIAIWHDESHMNRYFVDNKPKTLKPNYAYPENWQFNGEKICIQIDKSKYPGGHQELRS